MSRSIWARAAVTAVVLALLLRKIDAEATLHAIARLQLVPALLVLGLLAVDRAVMVWRWVILLRARGQPIALKSAVWIYLVSSFVGAFLPAGVGGDLARAYTLAGRTSQGNAAVASVALDRLLGLLSIVVTGVAGLAIAGSSSLAGSGPIVVAASMLAVVGTAMVLWADRLTRLVLPRAWHASGAGIRILRLAGALAAYRDHRAAVLAVSLLSVSVQLLRILQAYLLGVGIGIPVAFTYYLMFMPAALIALMLPISISGFGAPQYVIVWLLAPQGVQGPDAFALSTLIVLSGLIANLPGAILYLRRGTPRLEPERSNG